MSSALLRALRYGGGWFICLAAVSCGGNHLAGNSSGPVAPADNVVNVVVDGGPSGNSTNLLYTTVTVCVPGSTTNCQTIDHIQVDTGSTGLRLLAPVLTLSLPVVAASSGASLLECYGYVDGFVWGPIALVDVQISGESASSVPVHLIGDSRFPTVPSDCAGLGPSEDTVSAFGANGILGIGFQPQDCGSLCVGTAVGPAYYACTAAATCQATTVALASQVQNPVTMFTTDHNGTIITLPSVASGGAASVSGSLIFGIDTQSNNASSGATTVLFVDANLSDVTYGDFTTNFNDQALNASFIDSGSNGNYFNDSSITPCPAPNNTAFYCPAGTLSFTATLQGVSGSASPPVTFVVSSADTVPQTVTAYPGLAGTTTLANSFDWGLSFFYGRRVVTAIQGYTTSAGTGPYVAY